MFRPAREWLYLLISVVAFGYVSGPVGLPSACADTLSIRERFTPPPGFERIPVPAGSFGAWLRELPVRPGTPAIRRYDGKPLPNRDHHLAVLDLDVGSTDLQQCADVVIRLRAEYLRAAGCEEDIHFDFTNGDTASWVAWRSGLRPVVRGSGVRWQETGTYDGSYENFRHYLETVFMYAGSLSLSRELVPVADPSRPEIGDVIILGGTPGHAMLIVDVAENSTGERVFMLAQGLMPAQDIHILRGEDGLGPWIRAKADGDLEVKGLRSIYVAPGPGGRMQARVAYTFSFSDMKRFAPAGCGSAP